MLGICFFVDVDRVTTIRPSFRDWGDLGKAFGVDQVMYIDPSETQTTLVQYPNLIQHVDLQSAMNSTPDVPWVFVENIEDTVSLIDFTHPPDVVYCFGSDSEGLNNVDRNLGNWMSIPTIRALWANQAGAVVLSHRQFNDHNR